jgi:glutamyl-tRNA synthetase
VDAALGTCKEKVQQFTDLPGLAGFYFVPHIAFDPALVAVEFTPAFLERLRELIPLISAIESFRSDVIQAELKRVVAAQGVKMSVFVHPLRVACTGMTGGPSLYHLLEILGKEQVLARLKRALEVPPIQA